MCCLLILIAKCHDLNSSLATVNVLPVQGTGILILKIKNHSYVITLGRIKTFEKAMISTLNGLKMKMT